MLHPDIVPYSGYLLDIGLTTLPGRDLVSMEPPFVDLQHSHATTSTRPQILNLQPARTCLLI